MLDIKSTNNKCKLKKKLWRLYLVLLPVLMMAVFLCSYPRLSTEAENLNENPLESEAFVQTLYQCNYVLYKELYEKVHNVKTSYRELYFDFSVPADMEDLVEEYQDLENNYLGEYENIFHQLSQMLDYTITDDITGTKISNSGLDMSTSEAFYTYARMSYDASGHVGNIAVKGEQADLFLKRVSEQGRGEILTDFEEMMEDAFGVTADSKSPVNCTVAYGITHENWERMQEEGNLYGYFDSNEFTMYDFTAADSYLHTQLLHLFDLCIIRSPI